MNAYRTPIALNSRSVKAMKFDVLFKFRNVCIKVLATVRTDVQITHIVMNSTMCLIGAPKQISSYTEEISINEKFGR